MWKLLVRIDKPYILSAQFADFIHPDEKWKKLRAKRDSHKSEAENYKIKLDNATTDDAKSDTKESWRKRDTSTTLLSCVPMRESLRSKRRKRQQLT
jgi:hypothetical protein